MRSLPGEVETICMKYNGLLKSGCYSHPQLLEYERQMTEHLKQHSKVCNVSKQPTLILFNNRYLFNKTLVSIHNDAMPLNCDLGCLALFSTRKDSLSFKEYFLLPRAMWEKATIVKSTQCRSFNLSTLLPFSLLEEEEAEAPDNNTLTSSNGSSSVVTDEEREDATEETTTSIYTHFAPFWLSEQMALQHCGEEGSDYLRHYTQLVLDMVVWRRYFGDNDALKRKSLLYYARHIKNNHSQMTLLFISQMVQHTGGEMTDFVHKSRKDCKEGEWFIDLVNTRFYKEWLDTEVILFKEARWSRLLVLQTAQIQEHVAFIRDTMPVSVWPTWMSHTVNLYKGEPPIYWSELDDGNYEIRAEWLYKPELETLLQTSPLIKGHTCLSPQAFQTIFLPCLYRCMLEDVCQYLFHVYYTKEEDKRIAEARYTLNTLRNTHNYSRESMLELSQLLRKYSLYSATKIFDLISEIGDVCSPVTRKMVKKRPEFDTDRTQEEINATVPWYEKVIQRESVPDIEDLGKKNGLVPPCMRRVFNPNEETRPHLLHADRLNIVRFLIDLDYSKQEVVEFLCKGHQADAEYIGAINTAYESYTSIKRLNPKQIHSQHHSFPCHCLINAGTPQEQKSYVRCVPAERAEKKAGSHRRKDYNKDEKEAFMKECGMTLNKPNPYLKHPVQFFLSQAGL